MMTGIEGTAEAKWDRRQKLFPLRVGVLIRVASSRCAQVAGALRHLVSCRLATLPIAVAIAFASLIVVAPAPAGASASGGGITVTTYTGGCRSGYVDINPQIRSHSGWVFVDMYAALYDARGRIVATSGGSGSIVYRSFSGPSVATWPRWQGQVARGGAYVKVFAKDADGHRVLIDTATCRT